MGIFKRSQNKENSDVVHYVVMIDAPLEVVSGQLASWFDNAWRPSDSTLVYRCAEPGEIKVGSKCNAEFKKVLKVRWSLEVRKLEPNHFFQSALKGFFAGTETVNIEERGNGIKVDYRLNYELRNPFSQMLWSGLLEDAFVDEIRKTMDAFKKYCEKMK